MLPANLRSWAQICVAFAAPAVFAQSLVVLPGSGSSTGQINIYAGGALGAVPSTINGAAGSYQALSVPNGSKYYVFSSTTPVTAVTVASGASRTLADVSARPSAIAMSPDGRRLVIGVFGQVYVYDTATDTPLKDPTGGFSYFNLSQVGNARDIAISPDSQKAYIVSDNGFEGYLTVLDLNTLSRIGRVALTGLPTGVAVAPNGLIYVSMANRIWAFEPTDLTVVTAGETTLSGTPGRLVFTPDGTYAIALNRSPVAGGQSLWVLDTVARRVIGSVGFFQSAPLDNVYIAGPNRWFATSSQTNTLYDLTLVNGTPQLDVSQLRSEFPVTAVGSVAFSNEYPAKYLFATTTISGQRTLVQVDLATNKIVSQTPIGNDPAVLRYVAPAVTSGGTTITAYNTQQNVAVGAGTLPLVVRVTDAEGRGVSGVAVAFAVASGQGLRLSATSTVTNSEGYASTTASATGEGASNGGVSTISASASGLSANFTINITTGTGGGGNPGGGTGGGSGSGARTRISIASGNGQLLVSRSLSGKPLVVKVTDLQGAPAANVPVKFAITQGDGSLANYTNTIVLTDANGFASGGNFLGPLLQLGVWYVQTVITATADEDSSVDFVLTTVPLLDANGNFVVGAIAYLVDPPPATALKGPAGTVLPRAIRVQAVAGNGAGIPNVSLNLDPEGDPAKSFGSCAGGPPLTNAQGIATCDLLLGPAVGSGYISVDIGYFRQATPVMVEVTPGARATSFQIVAGQDQVGTAGQSVTLAARLLDDVARPLGNTVVTWQVVQGSATLGAASTISDPTGTVSNAVILGQTTGPVQVRATAGAAMAVFNLRVNPTVSKLEIVSGNNQTGAMGQAFGQELVVGVRDAAGNSVGSGTAVTFSVQTGSATLAQVTAITDAQGQARIKATPTAEGPISVRATAGSQSVTFNLTGVKPGPIFTAGSFVNGASWQSGISRCGIAVLTGTGMLPGVQGTIARTAGASGLPTQYTLPNNGSFQITVGGIPAPIFWVGNTGAQERIAFQVPCEIPAGSTRIEVTSNGLTTAVENVAVAAYAPGVFAQTGQDGRQYVQLYRASDGSYISESNPARRGDVLTLFATGLGSMAATNAYGTGQTVTLPTVVGINGVPVRVISATLQPGSIGLFAVTFEVPQTAQTGSYQLLDLVLVTDAAGTQVKAPALGIPIQ